MLAASPAIDHCTLTTLAPSYKQWHRNDLPVIWSGASMTNEYVGAMNRYVKAVVLKAVSMSSILELS
jgi:hypothetical protein